MTLVCKSDLNQVSNQFITFLQLHLYKKNQYTSVKQPT